MNDSLNKRKSFLHDTVLRIMKMINVIAMTAPFAVLWYQIYADNVYRIAFYRRGNWAVIFIYALLYFFYGRTYDAFQVNYARRADIVYSQTLSALITNFIMYFIIWLLLRFPQNVLPLLLVLACQVGISAIWAVLMHGWYTRSVPRSKAIVIYQEARGKENLIREYGYDKRFQVLATYQVEQVTGGGLSLLDGADTVFLVDIHSHDRNIILKYCIDRNITAFIQPRIGDLLMDSAKEMHMFHLPILKVSRYTPVPEYLFFKRLFDLVSSLLLLIILSPLFLAVSIAIKAYDGGPVFYRQVRLTKDGREFKVLKFRSMRVDAEKDGVARLSTGDADPRITPVGRFIRKVRLDELPQLINIIKGDMSVVGPRPERPEIAAEYEKELPEFRLRLQCRAGLTGYAQVYGKYNTEPYDKLGMDLLYIAHPSLVADIRIIFATIKILFLPESTEGVAEGQTTAEAESLTVEQKADKKLDK